MCIISKLFTYFNNLLRYLLLVLLLALSNRLAAQFDSINLPDLGQSVNSSLTPEQEFQLGSTVFKQISNQLKFFNDPITNEYLFKLGYKILATQPKIYANYQFFTIKEQQINAFALPGGFIGVNTGLLLAAETESELAGVLAHEIAHVQQRHIARMYEHMGRIRISTIAGVIAAIILSTQSPEAGQGALAATLGASQQAMINYTRDHEKEADFIGIHALAKAGFDPMGMAAFFRHMEQHTRFYGGQIPEYLLTHPVTTSRLTASIERAKQYSYKQIEDSLDFHLIRARARQTNYTTPKQAKIAFAKNLKSGTYTNKIGEQYGYILACINDRSFDLALKKSQELLDTGIKHPLIYLAKAEALAKNNNIQAAMDTIQTALQTYPYEIALNISYLNWLFDSKQYSKAIKVLQKQISFNSNYPTWYKLLAEAYSNLGENIASYIATAKYLKLTGDYDTALKKLEYLKQQTKLTVREKQQIDDHIQTIKRLKAGRAT